MVEMTMYEDKVIARRWCWSQSRAAWVLATTVTNNPKQELRCVANMIGYTIEIYERNARPSRTRKSIIVTSSEDVPDQIFNPEELEMDIPTRPFGRANATTPGE